MVSKNNDEYQRSYVSALRLLGLCDRSKKELKDRLSRKGYSPEVVETVIGKLESYDYINDERYALKFATDAVKIKNSGPEAVRAGLYRKGIDRRIIEKAVIGVFKDYDEKEVAMRAMKKKLKNINQKSEIRKDDVKRLSDHLRRKGFSYDIIRETLRETGKEDET